MATRVLSIEIGTSLTKVAELDFKGKRAKLYSSFVILTPPNMMNAEGEVNVSDVFTAQLNSELQERGIGTKSVVFVVNSSRVISRTITIPAIKENRIYDFVMANASDYFPYSLDGYKVSCEVDGRLEENGVKKLQVTVNCMPLSIVGAYEALAASMGFSLVGLDYAGNALKKMMLSEIQEDIKITFKMEETSTIITVIEDGKVQFQRTANYGIDEILEIVKKSELFGDKLSDLDALNVLERKTLMFKRLDDTYLTDVSERTADSEIDSVKLQQLRTEITTSLSPLVGNINKILELYDREKNKKIEKIYLIGLGSVCSGLSKLLTSELGIKVVAQQQIIRASVYEDTGKMAAKVAEFFTNCGATMEPLSVLFAEKKEEKGKGKNGVANVSGDKESYTVPIIVCGVCVIAAIALGAFSIISNAILKATNHSLQTQIDNLAYIDEIVATYDATCADYAWAVTVDENSSSDNDNLVAVINELEEKMPSEINILTLSASEESLTLNITVSKKAVVADVIRQLRTFESFTVGNLSTISEEEDDAGVASVSFSIDCTYVPSVTETAAEQTVTETVEETDEDASLE